MSEAVSRHLRVETSGDVTIVRFVEPKLITEEDIQELGEQLNRLVDVEGRRRILLDFDRVQYLSSAALGKLINLKKKVARAEGQLKLSSIAPDLMEVFKITRLDTVFEIHGDTPSALDAFR